MMRIITRTRQRKTQRDPPVEHIGSSAGVPGSMMRGSCGRRIASGAIQTARAAASVFDASPRRTSELEERYAERSASELLNSEK